MAKGFTCFNCKYGRGGRLFFPGYQARVSRGGGVTTGVCSADLAIFADSLYNLSAESTILIASFSAKLERLTATSAIVAASKAIIRDMGQTMSTQSSPAISR